MRGETAKSCGRSAELLRSVNQTPPESRHEDRSTTEIAPYSPRYIAAERSRSRMRSRMWLMCSFTAGSIAS